MSDENPTVPELKARAYDLIALKEQVEAELRQVNQAILEQQNEQAKQTVPEEAKKESKS